MFRRNRWTMWLAVIASFALLATACSDSGNDTTTAATGETTTTASTVPPKAPITVAAINQQDGVVAWPEVTSAVNAILAWYNAKGGIDGHPIELDLCTAGDDPESTQACAQKFANDDSVEFVFPMSIPNSDAMFQVIGDAGKPMVGHLLWDIPDSVQPDLYAADPGVLPMATVIVEYLTLDLGLKNIGIVTTDSPFGRDTADFMSFLIGEYGAATEAVFYDEGTADYLPAFASVDLDVLDAIFFLPFTFSECAPAAEALNTLGWDKVTASLEYCAADTFKDSGLFEGWYIVTLSTAFLDGNPDRDLLVSIFEEYGDGVTVEGSATNGAILAFWLIEVLEDAYALAGSEAITGDHIRTAAEAWSGHLTTGPDTLDCPGVGGFSATCNSSALVMLLEDGKFVDQTGYRLVDMSLYSPLLEG